MLRGALQRVVGVVTTHSKVTIAVMLVLTAAVGFGATSIAGPGQNQLGSDTVEQQKLEYIQANYGTGPTNVTTTSVYVRDADGNVLSKASLLASLRFQQRVTADADVAPVLAESQPVRDVSTAVATRLAGDPGAGIDAQVAALEDASEQEVRQAVTETLAPGSPALRLLPATYEPGTPTAQARTIVFTLREPAGGDDGPDGPVADAEQAIYDELGSGAGEEYFMLSGPALQEVNQEAQQDSLELIGPLALLFILVALIFAYRDLVDVVVGMLGVVLTLVWTFGFIGWLNVPFGSAAIIAPILLIGLSIDYGIHVFMRYREERETRRVSDSQAGSEATREAGSAPDDGVRPSMRRALSGVGVALVLVTVTTAIGFLSNLTNPLSEIRSLAVATSLGVTAALLVFVTLVPALKVEADALLERFGFDRRKTALGTEGGRVGRFLTGGVTAARTSAVLVLVVALALGASGAFAWTVLDTSVDSQPEQPPEWQQDLPEPFAMQEYEFIDQLAYVQENFQPAGADYDPAQVLVEGRVTDPATLSRIDAATREVRDADVVFRRSDGSAPIQTPVTVMQAVAASDESFAETLAAADTDGDGVPDRDVREVYDALYEAAPEQAATVIERRDGDYRSVRLVVPTRGTASFEAVAATVRDTAATIDGEGVTATATGNDVVLDVQITILTENILLTLVVSLVAILVLLSVIYRVTEGSATLGAVTVLPIGLVVAWVFGAMYLLSVPLTLFTALMISLAIGLGIDYAIHVSERFAQELGDGGDADAALEAAVTGTGGALLGSTTTTVGAFATLALSSFPTVSQLGIMVGLSLVLSFVASVFVLPSLLTLWVRYVGAEALDDVEPRRAEPTTDD